MKIITRNRNSMILIILRQLSCGCLALLVFTAPALGTEADDIAAILAALQNGVNGKPPVCPNGIDRLPVSYENELSVGITLTTQKLAPPQAPSIFPVSFYSDNVVINTNKLTVDFHYEELNIEWGGEDPTTFNEDTAKFTFYAQISPFLAFRQTYYVKDVAVAGEVTLPFPSAAGVLQGQVKINTYYQLPSKLPGPLRNQRILFTFSSQIPGQSAFTQFYNTGNDNEITLYCSNMTTIYLQAIPEDQSLQRREGILKPTYPTPGIIFPSP